VLAMVLGRKPLLLPAAIGVGLLAAVAYVNSLANGFVWDDQIILDRQLVAFRSLGDVLVPPVGIPQFSPDYYRPVVIASYLLDRALGGRAPFVYHCSVVVAHVAATVLLFLLALRLFRQCAGALFGAVGAAALFAVHPIHTESVAWIAGRSDVLAAVFTLAALIAHGAFENPNPLPEAGRRTRHPTPGPRRVPRSRAALGRSLATGVFVLLALGSKETAATVFPLLLLLDWLAWRSNRGVHLEVPDLLIRYAGPVAAGVAYLILRRAALGDFVGHAPGDPGLQRSAGDFVGAVALYLGRMALPLRLNAYIDSVQTDWLTLCVTAVVVVAVVGGAIALYRRNEAVPLFLLAWVVMALVPSLAIVWKIPEAPVAERYLYLPSVGYCLLLGWVAMRAWASQRVPRARVVVSLTLAGLVLAALVVTVDRNRVWRDNLSLWSDTASKSHVSGMPLRSLAADLQRRGRFEEARRHFEDALGRQNSRAGRQIILNNLGTLAMQAADYRQAELLYRQALEVEGNSPDALFNLGLAIFERRGRTHEAAREALALYRRAATLSPHDADIEAALGQALSIMGEREEAATHMRRALDLGVRGETAASIRAYLAQGEQLP
jgi:protein O-mannosyl-transferase